MTRWVFAALIIAGAGCGGDDDDFESTPADVSGSYTVSVTNKANPCQLPNWEQDKQLTGIPLTLTQDATTINGSVEGLVGVALQVWLGSSSFQGSVDGNRVQATSFGTRAFTQAACTYTINAVMVATLTGDALQGVIKYTPKTNASPDCGVLEGCESLQEFVGSRPPK